MQKYRFKAKNLNNKVIKGVFFAKDEDDLRAMISNLGYYLVKFKKIQESAQLFAFLEKIKMDEFALFCRQLAIMLDSGMELRRAVEILKGTIKNQKLKAILETVYHDLLQGVMLSKSFEKYPKTFPVFFRNMIYIGEVSGRLPLVLNRLANYYEKDNKTKRKVKSALGYPIFLFSMALAVLALISLYVMPIFKSVFESMEGAELPAITKIVISVTDFIRAHIVIILAIIIAVVLIFILSARVKSVKLKLDDFKLKAPIIKDVSLATITSRFTSGFATLLSSSLPILDALTIMSRLLGNMAVEQKILIAASEIKRGQGIAKSIETINIFPPILIEMLSVGEETGKLEEVLNSVCGYYEDQVDYSIKKMTGAIEPIMIIFIAALIMVVLLSVFMPMLEITNSIDTGA